MDYVAIGNINVSRLTLGCMRISDKPLDNNSRLLHAALDIGVNMFDHADIYGGGSCESIYGELLRREPGLRDRIVIQTKCGIRDGWYDLSYKHIVESVEGSLARLGTDRIDILLLHRPDTLMRPEEIAKAFDELQRSGKVLEFGVSNFSSHQTDYLQSYLDQKLRINQLQLSPTFCPMIDSGINVNTGGDAACERDGGVLEYCRKHGIIIQTYGTMQCTFTDDTGYFYSGSFMTDAAKKKYFALNFMLEGLAQKYGTTPEAVALAWVLRHPAGMQAIVGTTSDKRMLSYKDCCDVPLTNKEWYAIYKSAGHGIP